MPEQQGRASSETGESDRTVDPALYASAIRQIRERGNKPTEFLARQAIENLDPRLRHIAIPGLLVDWGWQGFLQPIEDAFVDIGERVPCSFEGVAVYHPDQATDFLPEVPNGNQSILLKALRGRSATELVRWSEIDPDALKRPKAIAVLSPEDIPMKPEQARILGLIEPAFGDIEASVRDTIRLLLIARRQAERRLKYPHTFSPMLDSAQLEVQNAKNCFRWILQRRASLESALHLQALGADVSPAIESELIANLDICRSNAWIAREGVPQDIIDAEDSWGAKTLRLMMKFSKFIKGIFDRIAP